jgi:hypothetical protein
MDSGTRQTQTFISSKLDGNCYLRRFQSCNQITSLHSFLFMKGMHFSDLYQWWNIKKKRTCYHEGLDIATFLDYSATIQFFPAKTLVPVLLSGVAVHKHRDFLGHTLYVRHNQVRQQTKVLHSLYAHIDMADDSGETIRSEAIIGSLSKVASPKTIFPHLHVTIAWIEENLKLEGISWDNISDHPGIQLVDPINFMTAPPTEIHTCM